MLFIFHALTMAAEGYVIFEDATWYQKHKEEIKEQIISLDTYVHHPMQIGSYLMREGEYWLKGIESKPPPADWPYNVRNLFRSKGLYFYRNHSTPPKYRKNPHSIFKLDKKANLYRFSR